jgi:hypothetical protein
VRRGKPPVITRGGPLAAALAIALSTSGCSDSEPPPPPPQVYAVCVDRGTMVRVDDSQCPPVIAEDDDDLFFFYFYPLGSSVHPVGGHVSGGSHRKPAGFTGTAAKAPPAGYSVKTGTVGNSGPGTKGGFGKGSGGSSGG